MLFANGPKMVLESTVSNTKLSGSFFFGVLINLQGEMSDEDEWFHDIPSVSLGLLASQTPAKETGFCRGLLGKECFSF